MSYDYYIKIILHLNSTVEIKKKKKMYRDLDLIVCLQKYCGRIKFSSICV